MSNYPLKLLFKNAFRVFGKTKVLAAELTVLTMVATTVLMATTISNVDLENSKNKILDNSNVMDFSINETPQTSIDVVINDVESSAIPKPQFVDYLNTNNFSSSKIINKMGTVNGLPWMNGTPNNKLAFYYVTTPTEKGDNLLKLGATGNSFASITLTDNSNNAQYLNQTAEIFSFIDNSDSNLIGIPNPNEEITTSFDMRQIIFDTQKQVAAGVSKFGYAQVLGFDLEKTLSISHNVVDTSNKNQFIVQSFKNSEGNYAVPNEMLIWLGEQDVAAQDFYKKNANVNNKKGWDFSSFANILSEVGNSINSFGADPNSNGWVPYEIMVNFNAISSQTKFLIDFFTSDKEVFKRLRESVNKAKIFDFNIIQITNEELTNPFQVYSSNDSDKIKSMRYLKTYAWLPNYLNESELNEALIELKDKYSNEVSQFLNKIIDPFSPWNNLDQNITLLRSNLNTLIGNSSVFSLEQLYSLGLSAIKNVTFNNINKDLFISIYQQNKHVFEQLYVNSFLSSSEQYLDLLINYFVYCKDLYENQNPTIAYYYEQNYTLEGILDEFNIDYKNSKNFSVNDVSSGNTYIINEYSSTQKINNVVTPSGSLVNQLTNDNSLFEKYQSFYNLCNWSFIFWKGPNALFSPEKIISYDGTQPKDINEYVNKNFQVYKNNWVPKYETFKYFNAIELIIDIYSNVEWLASSTQVEGILKSLEPFTKFENTVITKEIYETKIIPLIYDWFNVWILRSISINSSNIKIVGIYLLPFGKEDENGTQIVGNMMPKTSYSTVVSSSFLDKNKFDEKNNPKGKAIYPNFHSYERAMKLPYLSLTNNQCDENWIYNPISNQVEYYRDFSDWFRRVPQQYKISVNGIEFLITGSGMSPDFLYPVANEQMLLVNSSSTSVLYMNNVGYARALENSNGAIENKYISAKFAHSNSTNLVVDYRYKKSTLKKINTWIKDNISTNNYYLAYNIDDSKQPNKLLYTRMTFIGNFQKTIIGITMFISVLVLILSFIFICTLVRSIIKQNRQMFGVCLANGINRHVLALSFLPFSLIPGIISGVFGYLIGNLLQPLLNGLVSQYWTLPIINLGWVWWLFLLVPFLVTCLLFLISYCVVIWTLRKSATQILATPSSFRMNALVENSTWLFKHFRARTAFKFTYIFGNITRFFILMSIVTSFITLCSVTVGSLGTFDTALQYTQRNKKYEYAIDLYSPTIQGGFYDIKPSSLNGTSSYFQPSLYHDEIKDTRFYNPVNCGSYQINTQIFGPDKTLATWIQLNSISQGTNVYLFSTDITSKWVVGASENQQLKVSIESSFDRNAFTITPIALVNNGSIVQTLTSNPIQMVYYSNNSTYNKDVYKNYWINPYDVNNNNQPTYFDTIFYPSFEIVPDIQQDITFFTGKTWVKTLLDFEISLGAISINPWMFAKSLVPSSIIAMSEEKNIELLNRNINFYKYLDLVSIGKIDDIGINYQTYYAAMKWNNHPYTNNNAVYNPINIDGSIFEFDENNNIKFNENKAILIPKNNVYSHIQDYVLNVPVASKGLPTFELKPETVRTWTYISTNYLNDIYKRWETEVAGLKNENLNYSLGMNTVLVNQGLYGDESSIIKNDSTYTYLNATLSSKNNKSMRNDSIKVMGIKTKPYGDNKEPMVVLYDTKNVNDESQSLNSLLDAKVDDYYPLVINEVSSKYYGLKIGDILTINVSNGLFRYKRIGLNQNPNISVSFKIVGITNSKSELQFYTNQKFANEILGYTSNEDEANKMYPKDYVPFNGLFSGSINPNFINVIAPLYAPLGINPSSPLCAKTTSLKSSDNEASILQAWNKLNDIFKFNITGNEPINKQGVNNIINKIVDIGNNNNYSQTYMTICSEITGVDAKFANNIISGTIDTTVSNIELIAIVALLPTLFIIITLMSTMIITESKRLIAIMKVLGFGDWFNAFNFMFVYIVVLLLGLLLSIPLTYGLLAGLKAIGFGIFNIIINPVAPWWIYLSSAGIAGIVFILLFVFVKSKMKDINLSQAISFG